MNNKIMEQFAESDCTRNEKVRLLSVLPSSWSNEEIISKFKTNRHIVSEARETMDEKKNEETSGTQQE